MNAAIATARNSAAGQGQSNSAIGLAQVIKLATAGGFQRLNDAALVEMMHLRADLARRADLSTCADLWSGENTAAITAGIEMSPVEQQRRWAELFDEAAMAAIQRQPAVRQPPAADEVHLAMRRLLQAMPPPDQLAMLDLTADGARPTANEQCQGVKLFYGRMEKMDESDALIIIRSSLYH